MSHDFLHAEEVLRKSLRVSGNFLFATPPLPMEPHH